MMAHDFERDGYCVIPRLGDLSEIQFLKKAIQEGIEKCYNDLRVPKEDYLHSISRWVDPSPVTQGIHSYIRHTIQPFLEQFFGCQVINKKNNVICKTKYATAAVPCHQDISYSPGDPYEFTFWMAVDHVSCNSGVLQILPKSHLGPIQPAVDFWKLGFVDSMRLSAEWQTQAVDLPVRAGDGILFDSRTWHGSAPSVDGEDRFAIVSRWSRLGWSNKQAIPEKIMEPYGMWTAADVTKAKLKEYLSEDLSYHDLVEKAIARLNSNDSASFKGDIHQAKKALHALRILNLAAEKQGGGDAHGVIYPEVWQAFLRFLP